MTNPVLESTRPLIINPKYVRINEERIRELAIVFAKEELGLSTWNAPVYPEENDERTIDFLTLGNVINFAFTDFNTKEKYFSVLDGVKFSGAYGMWASLRATDKPITEAEFLKNLTIEEAREIFCQYSEIPMLEERVALLRNTGKILSNIYGTFANIVKASDHRLFGGGGLVDRLTYQFPAFEDSEDFEGKKVFFNKRAQLAGSMIISKFRNEGLGRFDDVSELTVFADYVLPKGYRHLGILVYSPELSRTVDSQELIPSGSREELEIRAATIHASKMLLDEINGLRDEKITAAHLDYKMWSESRKVDTPHHLTVTTTY